MPSIGMAKTFVNSKYKCFILRYIINTYTPFRVQDFRPIGSTRKGGFVEIENRPAPRTQLHLEVNYKRNYAREVSTGTIRNISVSGAFIEMPGPLRPNEKLTVNLSVSGRERKLIATVIWANENGCGIRFHHSNNRDLQLVDDLIYFVETKKVGTKSVLDEIFKKAS